MSTVDLERQPAGAPSGVGGQFAPRMNSAPSGGIVAESATGSFAFPPDGFHTADEMRGFFMNAPISDQILSNAQYAYKRMQKRADIDERHNAMMGNREMRKLEDTDFDEFLRVRDNLLAKARFDSERTFKASPLPVDGIRAILRARQLWNFSVLLPDPAEQQSVENTQITFRGQVWTAKDLAAHYQTEKWIEGVLSESDLAVADTINQTLRR